MQELLEKLSELTERLIDAEKRAAAAEARFEELEKRYDDLDSKNAERRKRDRERKRKSAIPRNSTEIQGGNEPETLHGIPRNSTEIHGNPRNENEIPRNSTENNSDSTEIHGNPRKSVENANSENRKEKREISPPHTPPFLEKKENIHSAHTHVEGFSLTPGTPNGERPGKKKPDFGKFEPYVEHIDQLYEHLNNCGKRMYGTRGSRSPFDYSGEKLTDEAKVLGNVLIALTKKGLREFGLDHEIPLTKSDAAKLIGGMVTGKSKEEFYVKREGGKFINRKLFSYESFLRPANIKRNLTDCAIEYMTKENKPPQPRQRRGGKIDTSLSSLGHR